MDEPVRTHERLPEVSDAQSLQLFRDVPPLGKIVQPNIGSTIGIVPALASANPGFSVLSHIALRIAAVLHSPGPDIFLPPHRE